MLINTAVPLPSNGIFILVRALAGGGAQRDAIELANGLFRLGWPMAIVTLDAEGSLSRLVANGLPVIDLGAGRKRRMALAMPALIGLIRRLRPAAIIASEAAGNILVTMAARLLEPAQRPRVILREVASPMQARKHDPFVQNRLAYGLAPWLYPLADRVVTLTEGARRDLVEHFGVPLGRVVNLGTNAVMTRQLLRALAEPKEREAGLVVSVGRLSPEKGHAGLIDAFALLEQEMPCRLVILGEGPERPMLERRIAALGMGDRVHLPGYASNPTELVRRAALFVSASRYEGFGNAIVEALACGTPVVSTDAPHGPRDILQNGALGTLVPLDDIPALAAAVREGLQTSRDPGPLRARAADFTTENAVARFVLLLVELGVAAPARQRLLEISTP